MTELKKILYVEDDEDIAEVAQMILEDIGGFEIKHCFSGQEAIDAFPSYNPQLILMDVMMPDMDGPKTFEKIKNLYGKENISVIFMTAKAQTHEQEAYKKMGAIGVILKPFDPMELCENIRNLWEKNVG
ncbi:MAG: response regulator [Alphaproteobacteria bacterium]